MAYTATMAQWGNSQGLRLPKQLCRELGVAIGDELRVSAGSDGKIIIAPLKKRYHRSNTRVTIADLFQDYKGNYQSEEPDWGKAVGQELEW